MKRKTGSGGQEIKSNVTDNESANLIAIITPYNATNQNVTWSSSNTAVVTVTTNGVVTAVAPGTATITVTTLDGGFQATCTVIA